MTYCMECGEPMEILPNGVAHHLTEDGEIDYERDADHAAFDEGGGEVCHLREIDGGP